MANPSSDLDTDRPIVIGNVGTTSIPETRATMQHAVKTWSVMQQAVAAWAEVVNENGGVHGRPVRVEVADDANDPATHLGLVKRMVEDRHAVAFAGVPAVDTQAASVPYLEDRGVPVVGGDLGNEAWGTSRVLFPQGIASAQRARMLFHAAGISGKSRFGLISTAPEPARQGIVRMLSGAAEEVGIEVVFDASIDASAPDYADVGVAAKRAGVELMAITAGIDTTAKVIEAIAGEGFHPTYVMMASTTAEEILNLAGKYMDGAIGVSRTVPWMADQPADLQVWREAMKANGLESDPGTLLGWVSGRILEEALRRIDGEVTPSAVAEALRALAGEDLDGMVAPLGFGSSPSEVNPGSNCFWPVVAKDGSWRPAETGRLCIPALTA